MAVRAPFAWPGLSCISMCLMSGSKSFPGHSSQDYLLFLAETDLGVLRQCLGPPSWFLEHFCRVGTEQWAGEAAVIPVCGVVVISRGGYDLRDRL